METASKPDNALEEICRQAAKVFAGEHWFPLSARAKKLIVMLEEQKLLEPRGDSDTVGRVTTTKSDPSTQMDLLHHSE